MRRDKIGLAFGILVLTLMSMALAETIYSGDTIEISIDYEIVNCSVTNSTWDLEGLNLSWYNKNIVISTVQNYKSDNLTISCWVIIEGSVSEYIIPSGGGGGYLCKYNENFDWNCSEWGKCIEGIVCNVNNLSDCIGDEHWTQTRTCKKYNNCHNTYGKPIEFQNCTNKTIGGDTDEHGCKLMAGYTWCEAKQKCLRTWEEPCDEIPDEISWIEKFFEFLKSIFVRIFKKQ